MDTERWQILLKAIDRGSLRAAAEEMGFTVSGISRSVATLEKELGFALLQTSTGGKGGGGAALTDEGRRFLASYRLFERTVRDFAEEAFMEIIGS